MKAILLLSLCLGIMCHAYAADGDTPPVEKPKPITAGMDAPALSGTTVTGTFDLAKFRAENPGQHVVIAFSRASW